MHHRRYVQISLYLKAYSLFDGRLVNAMGIRADKSATRARKAQWHRNNRMSVASREVFDWLTIF